MCNKCDMCMRWMYILKLTNIFGDNCTDILMLADDIDLVAVLLLLNFYLFIYYFTICLGCFFAFCAGNLVRRYCMMEPGRDGGRHWTWIDSVSILSRNVPLFKRSMLFFPSPSQPLSLSPSSCTVLNSIRTHE